MTEPERPSFRLAEIASRVRGEIHGNGDVRISGLSSLADAGPNDLSFYADKRYAFQLSRTRAGALLTPHRLENLTCPQVVVSDPFLCINELTDLFYPTPAPDTDGASSLSSLSSLSWVAPSARISQDARVGPFAHVGADAAIGSRTLLGPGVYVGRGARIGDDCVLGPNVVVLDGCRLGSRVIIHAGAVIGSDGFGFQKRDGRYLKLRHVGVVVIEDDVEIGANAAIDRGTLGATVIRRGVKLDNLVHIGHNVEIDEDTVMAAQSGISGSTVIGKRVMMGGQVGLVDHIRIGDGAMCVAQSGVIGDLAPGAHVSGYPARPHKEVLRTQAEVRTLGRLRARVRELEEKVARLLGDTPRDSG